LIKNWKLIVLWIIVIFLLLPFIINEARIFYEKRKFNSLSIEFVMVQKLIKSTQKSHFESKAPSSTYKIKISNFLERLNYIRETLPVVKTNLERFKSMRNQAY